MDREGGGGGMETRMFQTPEGLVKVYNVLSQFN